MKALKDARELLEMGEKPEIPRLQKNYNGISTSLKADAKMLFLER
jgi:hypothetical protein